MEIIIAIADSDLVISPADEKCFRAGNDPRPVVFGDAIAIEQGLAPI